MNRPRSSFANISQPDQKDLRQCWRTHPEVFSALHAIFGFTIDACASAENAHLPRFWTERQDAFAQDWRGERVFCNPPFRRCRNAMEKAAAAVLAVIVVPITTLSNKYLHTFRPPHIFLPERRYKYLPPIGFVGKSSNPIPTALVLYRATPAQLHQLGRLGSVYTSGAVVTAGHARVDPGAPTLSLAA